MYNKMMNTKRNETYISKCVFPPFQAPVIYKNKLLEPVLPQWHIQPFTCPKQLRIVIYVDAFIALLSTRDESVIQQRWHLLYKMAPLTVVEILMVDSNTHLSQIVPRNGHYYQRDIWRPKRDKTAKEFEVESRIR